MAIIFVRQKIRFGAEGVKGQGHFTFHPSKETSKTEEIHQKIFLETKVSVPKHVQIRIFTLPVQAHRHPPGTKSTPL